MPGTPEEFVQQANAATQQADKADAQAMALRAEADAVGRLLDSPLGAMGSNVWVGGAARTCHKEADEHKVWLVNVRGQLQSHAHGLQDWSKNCRDKAAAASRNVAVARQYQDDLQRARSAVPPLPDPLPPPGI